MGEAQHLRQVMKPCLMAHMNEESQEVKNSQRIDTMPPGQKAGATGQVDNPKSPMRFLLLYSVLRPNWCWVRRRRELGENGVLCWVKRFL